MRPFSTTIDGKEKKFGYGTLIIPGLGQAIETDGVHRALAKVSADCQVAVQAVTTGFNLSGMDLGSGFAQTVKRPSVLMMMGNGVYGNEAGETWHLLDQRLGMPITKVDVNQLGRVYWPDYNVVVMVNGNYNLDKGTTDRIKSWVQSGGTLITFKGASEWAIKQGLAKVKLVAPDTARKEIGRAHV